MILYKKGGMGFRDIHAFNMAMSAGTDIEGKVLSKLKLSVRSLKDQKRRPEGVKWEPQISFETLVIGSTNNPKNKLTQHAGDTCANR
jgi:hypothetical protein